MRFMQITFEVFYGGLNVAFCFPNIQSESRPLLLFTVTALLVA